MRITANIIDEEASGFDLTFCKLNEEEEPEEKRIYPPGDNWFFYRDPVRSTRKESERVSYLREMTQRFRNLHLSEPDVKHNSSPSDASTSKLMEKAPAEGTTPTETPPSWLHPYLMKMKYEIKKEIMEELSQSSQGEVHHSKSGASAKTDQNQFDLQDDVIHAGIFCDNCDKIIHGIRYKCGNCSDFDLCQECESLPNIHNKNHIFLKIRYPITLKMYQRQKSQELSPTLGKIYMSARSRHAKKQYEVKFVCDETIPDNTVLPPSTKFVKSWRIVNTGTRAWSLATKLCLAQSKSTVELIPSKRIVYVPPLRPGEEGTVSVDFTTPQHPGLYWCEWDFFHKNRPLAGDTLWCRIVVKPSLEEGLPSEVVPSDKASVSCTKIPEKVAENKQSEVTCIAEVITAVTKEHERGNMVPRKLVVTSHTATPNNTPFDLTPPKSPDHHEAPVKNLVEVAVSNSNQAKDSDDDDECSVVSLGSSESDTEFVVIPMPKCFNLSESFISPHIPHWFQDTAESAVDEPAVHKAEVCTWGDRKIQLGEHEVAVISSEPNPSQKTTMRPTLTSKTVSQETGVPELLENIPDQAIHNQMDSFNSKIHCVSFVTDASSSEISIIGSEENSPMVENVAQTIESINISLSSETASNGCDVDKVKVHVDNASGTKTAAQEVQTENEDQATDIPCSATFPKFPIEVIPTTYDPSPASNEERVVQVLPEGLVTGALSAAATVYNTARAVISTIQQPRTDRGYCLSTDVPTVHVESTQTYPSHTLNPMDQLIEMGFCNRQQNEELLKKHKGDVPSVVAELVNFNDNDWYASRHIPSPPPCFD